MMLCDFFETCVKKQQCHTCTWSFKAFKTLIQDLKFTRRLTTAVNQIIEVSDLHKHSCGETSINSL